MGSLTKSRWEFVGLGIPLKQFCHHFYHIGPYKQFCNWLFWKKLKVQAFIEYNSASKSRIYSWNRPVESNSSLVVLVIQFQTVTLKNSLKKKWPWSMYLQEFCQITLEVQCNSRKIVKALLLVDWQKKVDFYVWGIYFQIRWGLFQFCWGK